MSGNTILVTGATSGIGRALAEAFHDRGNRVVVTGRRQDRLDEVVAARPGMEAVQLDQDDPASVSRLAEVARERFPNLNVLVANAGISRAEDMTADGWDAADAEAIVRTNIMGPLHVAAAVLPLLRARGDATMLVTTSNLAFISRADFPTYCASKAFLHSWLQSVRHQLRRRRVQEQGPRHHAIMKGTPMTDDLIFYTHPTSRGRIVRWMLEEVGQPYRTELLDYDTTMKAPEYLAINPMGKVPTIRHGETVVTESAAICAYLADAFPAAGLAPARDDHLRGPYYRWLFFAAGPVEAALTNKALGVEIPAGRERMAGYGTFAAMLDGLEAAVSSEDYLVGQRFTAADLYVGSQIGFGMRVGMIESRPAFEAYWARLSARPAHQRAREIDEALTPPDPPVD